MECGNPKNVIGKNEKEQIISVITDQKEIDLSIEQHFRIVCVISLGDLRLIKRLHFNTLSYAPVAC